MNTAVTKCPRCTGQAGAHFAFCFVAQAWERLMGPGYPWAPPAPTEEPLPPEPDGWDWADDFEQEYGDLIDPPDYQGVAEDAAVAMGAPSDADWLPHGMWIAPEPAEIHVEEAVTHLPEGYYGPAEGGTRGSAPADPDEALLPPKRDRRTYNTEGLRKAREEALKAQEDAAVLFVYDRCELVPGGRVALSDLHDEYVRWRQEGDMPSMSKDKLRELLVQVGVEVRPGRLPGMRTSGRAPLLVHGLVLPAPVVEPEPEPEPDPAVKVRTKHALVGAKPGGELPKQVRELIEPLITEQGWEYQPHGSTGNGKPRVKSPAGKVCTLPSTPHLQGHTLENTRSFLKQNGAVL